MKIREILGDDLQLLQDAGLSRDEIISIAKIRKPQVVAQRKEQSTKQYQAEREKIRAKSLDKSDKAVDAQLDARFNTQNPDKSQRIIDKNDPAYEGWRNRKIEENKAKTQKIIDKINKQNVFDSSQGFLDRVARGAETTVAELKNIYDYATGNKVDPAMQMVVEDGRKRDEEYKASLRSPERKAEVKKLEEGYAKADGTWATTKAGAKLLYDTATNPKEWNMGGVVGEFANPINAVGLGSGKVVGALAKKGIELSMAKKIATGAVTGAVGQGALNAGYEYTAEKSLGHTDEEAKKAAVMGAVSGASMGGVLGGHAGAVYKPKIKAKLKEKHGENYTKDYNELLDNELMQVDEAETHSNKAQPIIEEIAKQTNDPQKLNELVAQHAPPTPKEEAVSLVINNNLPVSPRLAGGRVRNALVKSIENPVRTPEQLKATLMSEGFNDESSTALTIAYAKKDVTIYDDYVAHKMSEVIDTHIIEKQKQLGVPKDERATSSTEDRAGNEPTAENRANESSTTVRGDNEPNTEQTSQNRSESTSSEPIQDPRQHISQDSSTIEVPKEHKGVDKQQTVNNNGSDPTRITEDQVVSSENGVANDGWRVAKETQADRVRKSSEVSIGGSEDEAKARVKALFRKKEKPKTYDKEELKHYAEQYFRDTYSNKELDNAIAHLPKKEAKKIIEAKNGKIDEKSIDILENLRRDGFPHMDEEIGRYEKLTDKYFSEEAPTPKEEAEILSLESELKDYFNKEEYIDARTKRKELETVSNDAGNKSPKIKGNEPQRSSSTSEVEVPRNKGLEDVSDTDVANIKPTTKGERKAINAQVEELIKKPLDKITPEDKKVLENYTGKGGLESGTKESLTQHYTDDNTISAMYKALDDAGVPTKTALEPAVGSGNFLKNRKNTKFTTVDIDKTNHEVVKRLYQDAEHVYSGYEAFKPSKKFDLVISNIPFSEERGAGRLAHRPDVKALHDHFFIKALEDVKDNGVIAFITSKGVMDKANSKIRKEITANADVIGAYRLPDSTFKHTHTNVVTDVIFLQKRPKGAKSRQAKTNELFETSSKDDGGLMSDYYRAFPNRVLGDMKKGVDPMYGNPTYLVTGEADLGKMKIHYKPYEVESQNKSVSDSKRSVAPQKGLKKPPRGNKKSKNELKTELLEKIKKDKRIEDVEEYKKKYKKHPFDDKGLKAYHKDDIESLYELGSYFDKEFTPAESFYSKTQHKGSGKIEVSVKSPFKERLQFNEDTQGIIDLSTAKHLPEKIEKVLKEGYAYIGDGKVQNEVLYYSGNVYKKIDEAKKITDIDVSAQIKNLKKALPKPKKLDDMLFSGAEPWLLENNLNIYRLEKVEKKVSLGEGMGYRIEREWKSEFGKTFDAYLNGKKLVSQGKDESEIAYRRKLREAESEVKDVLAEIKQRAYKYQEEIEDIYNRKFNFYKAPEYSKLHYMIEDVLNELPDGFSLRETQKKFVIKALYEGKNINAHDVGGGKTFAGVVLGRVLKQKGIAKKPLYVVPSKVIKNWEKEIKELFPQAKVVNLGNLNKATRTKKLFELSNQNADFVLISQEGFKALKLPKDKELAYTDELLRENMRNDDLKGRAKAIQDERIALYKEVISQANNDKRITIDKLGIDAIIADEARAYKNIGVRSSLARKGLGKPFGLNITKNGATLQSALAYDFRLKTKYISEMNNNRNIYMLDATPTPNKPLELFTMLKHLDDKIFDEYNIRTDEDFVNQFLETGQVQDKNGKFKDSITGIKNVFELRSIMDRFIDRISMQEFKDKGYIDIPESKTYKHIIESSDESDMVFSDISERLAEAKSDIKKRKDVLGIFSNGVSASVDPRLYKKMNISELAHRTKENNKIDAVISKVVEAKTKDKKAGQIIFVDSAGQNAEHLPYNLHQELKQKLIKEAKYKKSEVAILSGQEITDAKGAEVKVSGNKMAEMKQEIVERYNAGKIKVVIGTTKSAGEGMNIQKFTKDIYHLDLPWTPAEITQRNGRGVRYGNKYKEVNIHYFFTQGSFDDLMFNTVTKKQGWNDAIWDTKAQSHLKISDNESGGLPNVDEIFLSMEKDPIKRRELELEMQHRRLEEEVFSVEDDVRYTKAKMNASLAKKAEIEANMAELKRKIEHEVVDTESLKELQKKAIKNDKKFGKKFDEALAQRQESRKRWLKQLEERNNKVDEMIERDKKAHIQAKEDFESVQRKLDEFESENVGDDGKYLSGLEGC